MEDNNESVIDGQCATNKKNVRDFFGLYGFVSAFVAWVCLFIASGVDAPPVEWIGLLTAASGAILSALGLKRRYPNLAIAGLIMSVVLLLVVSMFMIAIFMIGL